MAMVCDACGAKFARDGNDGCSTLAVTPPRLDFKSIQALISVGKYVDPHDRATHDLCLGCTVKALAYLGLPTDICELPELPVETPRDGAGQDSPAGALTPDDLRALGIEPSVDLPAK